MDLENRAQLPDSNKGYLEVRDREFNMRSDITVLCLIPDTLQCRCKCKVFGKLDLIGILIGIGILPKY